MMSRRPTFKHRLEYFALGVVFLLGSRMPRSFFVRLGALIAGFAYSVLKVRRQVTIDNLGAAFPEKSDEELDRLARSVYAQLGGSILEFAAMPGMDRADLAAAVHIENLEYVDELRRQGRGIMFVIAHYGSWELFGASLVAQGYPATAFVKRQKNPLVADLQDDIRRRAGVEIVTEGPGSPAVCSGPCARGDSWGSCPIRTRVGTGSSWSFSDALHRPTRARRSLPTGRACPSYPGLSAVSRMATTSERFCHLSNPIPITSRKPRCSGSPSSSPTR
jgi:hypothetical protein